MSRYIDADAFIEENDGAENSGWTLKELINSFPSADVRPNVHGEWILDDSVFGFPKWNCSKCEKEGRSDYLFCPHCGAEMRKGVKNERKIC